MLYFTFQTHHYPLLQHQHHNSDYMCHRTCATDCQIITEEHANVKGDDTETKLQQTVIH